MEAFLEQYGQWLGLIGLVLALGLGVVVFVLASRLKASNKRWSALLNGTTSGNIEKMLLEHMDRSKALEARADKAEERLKTLEAKMETAKRFVGVVRYDAFEDVGGSQSFALAVYDEKGDGALVTSMVGRTDCRVYAKEIKRGKADRELSIEEQNAITAAVKTREPAGTAT
jgi:hypothetical protein